MNLNLTDDQIKEVTAKIKKLGDVRPLNIDDVDSIIKDFHAELSTPLLKPVNKGTDDDNIDISNGHVSKKAKVTK